LVLVIVVFGCLTVTLVDCGLVDDFVVGVAVDVTVLAPSPVAAAMIKATARPAMNATTAAAQAHERPG
jgi:hypothetical protein